MKKSKKHKPYLELFHSWGFSRKWFWIMRDKKVNKVLKEFFRKLLDHHMNADHFSDASKSRQQIMQAVEELGLVKSYLEIAPLLNSIVGVDAVMKKRNGVRIHYWYLLKNQTPVVKITDTNSETQ